MRKIGYCHGVTHKILHPYSAENIELYKNCGCTAIEVHVHAVEEVELLDDLRPLLDEFEYRSFHMPAGLKYRDDEITNELLRKISGHYHKIGASLAVVHPDVVEDWSVFDRYPGVRWAVENMDDRKTCYKSAEEMVRFFDEHPAWHFVLDVGHCNANDKTMKLADDLIAALRDKIAEIHLSGYEVFHDPLHRTHQTEIIGYCRDLDVPIIIESTFEVSDGMEAVAREFDYIVSHFKN